jgi:hypothetical protein
MKTKNKILIFFHFNKDEQKIQIYLKIYYDT